MFLVMFCPKFGDTRISWWYKFIKFMTFIHHDVLEEFVSYIISSCTKRLETGERQRIRIWSPGMDYPQRSLLNRFQIFR